MIMLFLAFSMAVIDQDTKRAESYEVSVRLMWDEHGHIKWPDGSIVNLHPSRTIKESQVFEVRTSLYDMPSFDPWVNFIDNLYVEELAPCNAIPDRTNQIWAPEEVNLVRFQLSSPRNPYSFPNRLQHCPWHVTMQIHFPQFFEEENVLYYGIIRKPSSDSPYFEAFVSCMPNIKCKEKTIEELERQLLKEYASYLSSHGMTEETVDDHYRRQRSIRSYIVGVSTVE